MTHVPLRGGILIGGRSSRMGAAKHLLRRGGVTLFEHVLGALGGIGGPVFALGRGEIPVAGIGRVDDEPGIEGPLAGILAALRHEPGSAWVIASCDLPWITPAAVRWLVGQRGAGESLAVLPRTGAGQAEPLLAIYEPAARAVLEEFARAGRGPRALAAREGVAKPAIPAGLASCWRSANTPDEWRAALRGVDGAEA